MKRSEQTAMIGIGLAALWLLGRNSGAVGKIEKEAPPGRTPCADGTFSSFGPKARGGVCSYHGGRALVQAPQPPQRTQYQFAEGRAQNVVSPDKTISASVKQAIKDVLTLPKFKGVTEPVASIIYRLWKNDFERYIEDEEISKIEAGILSKYYGFKNFPIYVYRFGKNRYTANYDFELTKSGAELINLINARLETLKLRKQGLDMFPDIGRLRFR